MGQAVKMQYSTFYHRCIFIARHQFLLCELLLRQNQTCLRPTEVRLRCELLRIVVGVTVGVYDDIRRLKRLRRPQLSEALGA